MTFSGGFNFWTSDTMTQLWNGSGWLMSQAAPLVMILFALYGGGLLIAEIVKAVRQEPETEDDDEDWEDDS